MTVRERAGRLVLAAIAVAASAVCAAPASAPAAGGRSGQALVLSTFELEGSHGYKISGLEWVEGDAPAVTEITAERGALSATYEVRGDLEAGIHADFGELGRIDLTFVRAKRVPVRVSKGCREVIEFGIFEGELSFTGEGGYTQVSETSVPGEVTRFPDGFCALEDFRPNSFLEDLLYPAKLTARERTRNGYVELRALHSKTLGTDVAARVKETVGQVTISREASALNVGSFKFGRGKRPRRATVKPSGPFQGWARYRNPRGAERSWRGPLHVSFPGLPDVALAGPDFRVKLCRRIRLTRDCKVKLPGRRGPVAQISGSQSQDLGEARLSWSR